MSVLITDAVLAGSLLEQRRISGRDRYDEVWDGVYVMSPMADNQHQDLATELAAILRMIIDWQGRGRTLAGANVSDRRDDWTKNYRVPDLAVFLQGTSAEDCGTHWCGGPDFGIEIVSPGDQTLEKLGFYALVGTRELLVIDRDPWQCTLYRPLPTGMMMPVAVASLRQPATIISDVLPICIAFDAEASCLRLSHPGGQTVRDIPVRLGV